MQIVQKQKNSFTPLNCEPKCSNHYPTRTNIFSLTSLSPLHSLKHLRFGVRNSRFRSRDSVAAMELQAQAPEVDAPTTITIKGILGLLMSNTDPKESGKRVISLGIGDPTAYSCFHASNAAQEGVVEALRSAKFNGYAPTAGLPQTRE